MMDTNGVLDVATQNPQATEDQLRDLLKKWKREELEAQHHIRHLEALLALYRGVS